MAPKRTFPPLITASKWSTVFDATWNAVRKARGFENADDGTIVPILSNGEAVALVSAWEQAATRARFPLGYQFRAVAYGWDGAKRDTLTISAKQRDALFPSEIGKELWIQLMRLSGDLDDEAVTDPKLTIDPTTWDNPISLAGLRSELQQDGAQAAFKIPTGMCRDRVTGRSRVPRPKCDANGRGPINPIDPTGPRLPCDKPGDCEPITIDDPITVVKKDFAKLAILAVVAWIVWKETTRQRRTRK